MGILELSRNLGIRDNLTIRVIDQFSGKCVQSVQGHNASTGTLLRGIGHYLIGDGVLNQGSYMLGEYIPKYISLGTMGLPSQDMSDDPGQDGLPKFIGIANPEADPDEEHADWSFEHKQFNWYLTHCPGFGADGLSSDNNERSALGLGRPWDGWKATNIECELISANFPRVPISYRQVVTKAELTNTIDVVFSAMVSTGALKSLRPEEHDYLFISEVGMWNTKQYISGPNNGFLAGYRIIPSNEADREWPESEQEGYQKYINLKSQIIRVGPNQVVQIVWKFQLGALSDLDGIIGSGGTTEDITWRQY